MERPISASPPPLDSRPAAEQKPRAPNGGVNFRQVFQNLSAQVDQGEAVIERSLQAHGHLNSTQLLALQAGMYRYTETVELVTKLVDRTSNAVRTTMQGQ